MSRLLSTFVLYMLLLSQFFFLYRKHNCKTQYDKRKTSIFVKNWFIMILGTFPKILLGAYIS